MTLALTDSVVELLDEVAAIVMARKIEACRNADACVDVSPLIVGVKDDNLVWGETNPLLTRPVVDEVRGMLRSMYSHPVMRRLDYVVCAVDSFVRYLDREVDGSAPSYGLPDGSLAKEYQTNPFTDVVEGFTLLIFDATGDFLDAFVEYKRDDKGMPVVCDKVIVGDSVRGATSDDVFRSVEEFVLMCRVSPDDLPPSDSDVF